MTNAGFLAGGNYLMFNTEPALLSNGKLTITFVAPWNNSVPYTVLGSNLTIALEDTEWNNHKDPTIVDRSISTLATTYDLLGNPIESWTLDSLIGSHTFSGGHVYQLVITDLGGDGFRMGPLDYELETPEPGTLLLVAAGLFGLGLAARRRTV